MAKKHPEVQSDPATTQHPSAGSAPGWEAHAADATTHAKAQEPATEPAEDEYVIDDTVVIEDLLNEGGWRDPVLVFNVGAVIVLALVAMATAWSGYQTARYSGMASAMANQASAIRSEALALSGAANDKLIIDLTVFTGWLNASIEDKDAVASFYEERMRQEFVPAFAAWKATSPEENALAPSSPFAMPEYIISEQVDSDALMGQVEDLLLQQTRYNERSDAFLFVSVLLALVLFFITMAQRFETAKFRFMVAAMGLVVLIWALVQLARLSVMA